MHTPEPSPVEAFNVEFSIALSRIQGLELLRVLRTAAAATVVAIMAANRIRPTVFCSLINPC